MPTVGRILVQERVRQGLELADIARVTKLSSRALQAIESDDFEQLPGTVFARKFVGQYAAALNLDSAAVIQQFEREQSIEGPQFTLPKPDSVPRAPRVSDSKLNGIFDSNILSAFTTFIVTLLVCAVAYYGYEYLRNRSSNTPQVQAPQKISPPVTPAVTAVAAPPETKPATTPTAETPSPVASTPAAVPTEPSASNVQVSVTATDACWVHIVADSKSLFTGFLAAGESRSVNADTEISIRAGNAGALAIKLNGNEIAPIGPKGQIRTALLTASGVQVRTPTSAVPDL